MDYAPLARTTKVLCLAEFAVHLLPLVGVPPDYSLWGMLGFPILFFTQLPFLGGILGDAFRLSGPKNTPPLGLKALLRATLALPLSIKTLSPVFALYLIVRFLLPFRFLKTPPTDGIALGEAIPPIFPLALSFGAFVQYVAFRWVLPRRNIWLTESKIPKESARR